MMQIMMSPPGGYRITQEPKEDYYSGGGAGGGGGEVGHISTVTFLKIPGRNLNTIVYIR